VRLVYVLDAGLPDPLVNHPVLDAAGHFLGTRTCSTRSRVTPSSTTAGEIRVA